MPSVEPSSMTRMSEGAYFLTWLSTFETYDSSLYTGIASRMRGSGFFMFGLCLVFWTSRSVLVDDIY